MMYYQPVKGRGGELLTSPDQQLKRWEEHFRGLLNPTQDEETRLDDLFQGVNRLIPIADCQVNTEPLSEGEVKNVINGLKNGKSPGIDNIPPEALKADCDTTAKLLLPIIQRMWTEEIIPSEWKKGLIIKLPKKGDLTNCDNWRGITLLTLGSKVLSRIILERIKDHVEQLLRKEQVSGGIGVVWI